MSSNPTKKKSSKDKTEKSDKNEKSDKKSKSSSSSSSKLKDKKSSKSSELPSSTSSASILPSSSSQSQLQLQSQLQPSSDFEAGLIFNKYDPNHTGMLTASAFREMWKEQIGQNRSLGLNGNRLPFQQQQQQQQPILSAFDAGTIFSKFDSDQDGKLSKKEFEELVLTHPELLSRTSNTEINSNIYPNMNTNSVYSLPHEVVTGRLLTHYDETAGVAIPKTSILSHEQMGNTVRPLIQAYSERYDRLRTLLTSKLLPRRENLLQLRRQLTNTSSDIEAARVAIERETMADAEKIIERLRNVESMKQSSIQHQILQLDDELNQIERLVRRVEIANEKNSYNSTNGITITSAATNGNIPTTLPSSKHVSWSYNDESTSITQPPQPPQQSSSYLLHNDHLIMTPRADLMIELIQQYADLIQSINKLTNKQIVVQLDYNVNDFPKEISERLEIISKYEKYRQALEVKDHMLWLALQDREKFEEIVNDEKKLSLEYAEEINQWAELTQHLKVQCSELQQNYENVLRENNKLINILRENGIHYTR